MSIRHIAQYMTEERIKPNQYSQDCSAIKYRVDEIMKELEIHISISYASSEAKENRLFERCRGRYLMKEYEEESKCARRSLASVNKYKYDGKFRSKEVLIMKN